MTTPCRAPSPGRMLDGVERSVDVRVGAGCSSGRRQRSRAVAPWMPRSPARRPISRAALASAVPTVAAASSCGVLDLAGGGDVAADSGDAVDRRWLRLTSSLSTLLYITRRWVSRRRASPLSVEVALVSLDERRAAAPVLSVVLLRPLSRLLCSAALTNRADNGADHASAETVVDGTYLGM